MLRIAGLVSCGFLVCCLRTANAQVAVTDLVPGAPSQVLSGVVGFNGANFTPDNPAALLWGAPTRVGLGGLRTESTDHVSGETTELRGEFGGLRLVGEVGAFGLEHLARKDRFAFNETVTNGQFSAKVADFLSWGIGGSKTGVDDGSGSTDLESVTLGISFNLWDWLFVGYALGNDELKQITASAELTAIRDLRMFGVAIRTNGAFRFYIEWYGQEKKPFETAAGPTGEAKVSSGALQIIAWNVLVGVATTSIKLDGAGDIRIGTADLGFAPEQGFAVTARLITVDDMDPATSRDVTDETWSLAVTYQF